MFPTPDPTRSPDHPVRILVVEDSRTQAERLRHILRQQDYEVEVTGDGVAALRVLEQFRADLVISDVNMPKMDGYQLARRIKSDPSLRETPVILVTNMSDPEDVIRGLESGADNFVIKPFEDRYILGRVRYVLANWEVRSPDDPAMGVGIHFNGQRHFITADRLQILNLLLSTYEAAIQRTRELSASKESLERRSAEISLAHRFLDQVIENIPHGIFVKDAADLRYLRVNRAMEEILGHGREQLVGHGYGDFFAGADAIAAREREILAGGGAEAADAQIPTARGVRIVHVRKLAVLDESGAARYLLGIAEDVTEKKAREAEILRLNAELERRTQEADAANRSKSTFLATMSHEIRTPMNGMSGLLELLALTDLDAEQRALLDAVRESGASLLRIVDDVLDFSKIEAGELAMHPEPVSIRRIVQDVQRTFAAAADKKGLALRARLDPDLSPVLWVDPLRLRQILANFVSNAVKFTPRGSVEVTAEVLGRDHGFERVRVQVRDTGIGISAADRQRLFQPFRQGEAPAVRQAGGTGLGLSICRRLTELMDGSLAMESEPGQGTTMTLELTLRIGSAGEAENGHRDGPALPALPPLPAVPGLPDVARRGDASGDLPDGGPRLLVVDDHPTNRMLLLRQVKTLGYAADAAEHGAEALQMWRSGRYALVLTDCEMPVMDGYELAAAIRSAEREAGLPRTPIVACTANALGGGADRCLEAGMDECLVKPIDLRGLQTKLAQWLPPRPEPQAEAQDGGADGEPTSAPLDLSLVQDTWGDDQEGVAQALDMFRRANDQDAAALLQAVAAGDAQAAARSSHRIAGASRMIGAEALAAPCMQINRAARAGNWDEVRDAMGPFEREWRRLNAYLDGLAVGGEPSGSATRP